MRPLRALEKGNNVELRLEAPSKRASPCRGCALYRAGVGSAKPLALPHGSYCKSLVWSKDGERLLAGANANALLLLKYPADDRYMASAFWAEGDSVKIDACASRLCRKGMVVFSLTVKRCRLPHGLTHFG